MYDPLEMDHISIEELLYIYIYIQTNDSKVLLPFHFSLVKRIKMSGFILLLAARHVPYVPFSDGSTLCVCSFV